MTFTSASAVLNFAANFGADQASDLLAHTVVAVQGAPPPTPRRAPTSRPLFSIRPVRSPPFAEAIVNRFKGN